MLRSVVVMDTTQPDEALYPFTLTIPDTELAELRSRLLATRGPAPLPGDGWDTGVPVAYLRRLVRRWTDSFDWRAVEARVNRRF